MAESGFHIHSSIGTYDEDWEDIGLHHNITLEIEIVIEGRGIFELEDRQIFIEAGHVIIIPPGIPHRFAAVTKVRLGVIHLQGMPAAMMNIAEKLTQGNGQPQIYALSRLDQDRFEKLFREWILVLSSPLKERQRTHEVWAEMLLLYLYEHSKTDLQAMTITKAADFLRENLTHRLKMADLAKLTGLTVVGFRRTFEKIYQLSPKQYQQQCRMRESKWLLSATDKDMKEIAEQVGFHRLHSFSQWFKSAEGISPSQWRKQQWMMHNYNNENEPI